MEGVLLSTRVVVVLVGAGALVEAARRRGRPGRETGLAHG